MGIQDFLDGHAECAIWLAYDADDSGELKSYDWGSGAADGAVRDCLPWLTDSARMDLDRDAREFYRDHLNMLHDTGADMGQLGHDFWLSREGHGTGFWDRGYPNGDELHRGAQAYGSGPMLYVDDGSERISMS